MLCSGIVGLPNVGKSTTFNLLTKLSIPAENFPFCTIEPNSVRFLNRIHAQMLPRLCARMPKCHSKECGAGKGERSR